MSSTNWVRTDHQPPWRPDPARRAGVRTVPCTDPHRAAAQPAACASTTSSGLFRLWWIPQGEAPTQGTYIRYDHEAMIGIVALEAQRAAAVVVGEDLGTVEPWVRDYLGATVYWARRFCGSSSSVTVMAARCKPSAGENTACRR